MQFDDDDVEFKVVAFDITTLTENHRVLVEVDCSDLPPHKANEYIIQTMKNLKSIFAPAEIVVYPQGDVTFTIEKV